MNSEDDICYYDPSFYPTEETALEYFRNSSFYDKTCNNEILHMQIQYTNNKIDIKEKLREMVGMEYSFRENLNNIFIIQKCYRSDYNTCTVIDLYYILNGIIFKAPTDKSVFISRFINFTHFINKALDIFDKKIEIFNENELQENDEDLNEILKILSDFKLRE